MPRCGMPRAVQALNGTPSTARIRPLNAGDLPQRGRHYHCGQSFLLFASRSSSSSDKSKSSIRS